MASQRDFMRMLVKKLGRDKEKVCAAYADAERNGEVARLSNKSEISPEAYAEALYDDGERKGWF
jgi:hypothetical protein